MDLQQYIEDFSRNPETQSVISRSSMLVIAFADAEKISEDDALNILNICIKSYLENKCDGARKTLNEFKDLLRDMLK